MNATVTNIANTTTPAPSTVDDFQAIYKSIYGKLYTILSIFELLNIIFFIAQFRNKKSLFNTPYFAIFTVGLIVNLLCNIPFMNIKDFYNEGPLLYSIVRTISLYSWFFVTTIHISLIANRCTALWFPFRLTEFWNFRNSFIIILINLLLPYAFGGFYLFKVYATGPAKAENAIINKIELIFIMGICLLTIAIVIFFHNRKISSSMSEHFAKIEKRLIYQSIIVLICVLIDLSLYRIVDDMIFKPNQIAPKYQDMLYMVADVFYIAQQILDVIFLFIVSEPFRTSILNFYTFGSYSLKKKNSVQITHVFSIRNPIIIIDRE